jgi:hypothetical protein
LGEGWIAAATLAVCLCLTWGDPPDYQDVQSEVEHHHRDGNRIADQYVLKKLSLSRGARNTQGSHDRPSGFGVRSQSDFRHGNRIADQYVFREQRKPVTGGGGLFVKYYYNIIGFDYYNTLAFEIPAMSGYSKSL